MISKISNIVITNTSNVTLVSSGKPRAVPPVNSLVMVNVLEKTNGVYKILVNGSLFQTKIHVNLNAGDQLLAKVINHSPFTISMDSFTQSKNIDQNLISVLLARLDIKETNLSRFAIKNIIGNKKILHKRKIERLLEYIEESELKVDDLQLGLLINIIWTESDETSTYVLNALKKIFDISFQELCAAILETIESLYSQKSNPIINNVLNLFVLDPEKIKNKDSILPVRDKSRPFLELIERINISSLDSYSSFELRRLKSLMLKYILQKSLLNRYNSYPEFVIIKDDAVLTLTIIHYERLTSGGGEVLFKSSFVVHKNGSGDFFVNFYLGVDKLTGEISMDFKNLKYGESFIEMLNEQISKNLGVISNLRIILNEVFKNIHPDVTEKLDSINSVA